MDEKVVSLSRITNIYDLIAYKFDTTASAVERAIKNLRIKSNFDRTTNKHFLARLQVEYKGENK